MRRVRFTTWSSFPNVGCLWGSLTLPGRQDETPLFLVGQDHLLTLAASLRQSILLGMLPHVLLASLKSIDLLSLDLTSLLDGSRHMTLASDSLDLGHVRVSLDQSLVVLELRALTGTLDSTAIRRIGTPQADVAVVRAGEEILVVGRELGGENTALYESER